MSRGFSLAVVEGGLGRDPEIKATPNGTRVANFSLGYDRGFKDNVRTCWINVVAFKEQADLVEKYLKKGKQVRVTGEIDVRSWDDKETGKKRYVTEIVANKIDFVDSGERSGGETQRATRQERAVPAPRQQAVPQTRAATGPDSNEFTDDSDLPF